MRSFGQLLLICSRSWTCLYFVCKKDSNGHLDMGIRVPTAWVTTHWVLSELQHLENALQNQKLNCFQGFSLNDNGNLNYSILLLSRELRIILRMKDLDS